MIYEYWFARMKNISDNKKKKLREAYGSAKEIYYIEETQLRLQNFLTKKDIEQLKMARKNKNIIIWKKKELTLYRIFKKHIRNGCWSLTVHRMRFM